MKYSSTNIWIIASESVAFAFFEQTLINGFSKTTIPTMCEYTLKFRRRPTIYFCWNERVREMVCVYVCVCSLSNFPFEKLIHIDVLSLGQFPAKLYANFITITESLLLFCRANNLFSFNTKHEIVALKIIKIIVLENWCRWIAFDLSYLKSHFICSCNNF